MHGAWRQALRSGRAWTHLASVRTTPRRISWPPTGERTYARIGRAGRHHQDCLIMPTAPHGLSPLSDEEVQELEDFLMEDRDGAEAMMFDTMDGYLHAVAIGPTTLKPQQ